MVKSGVQRYSIRLLAIHFGILVVQQKHVHLIHCVWSLLKLYIRLIQQFNVIFPNNLFSVREMECGPSSWSISTSSTITFYELGLEFPLTIPLPLTLCHTISRTHNPSEKRRRAIGNCKTANA